MQLKESFKGSEFWRKMNFGIIFLVYAFLFIMMAFPQYSITMLTFLGFFIVGYIAFQQYYFREMDKKNRGKTVQSGWVTHNYGAAEEYEFSKVKYEPIEKLSNADRMAVDLFINEMILNVKERRKELKPDLTNIQSEKPKLENKIQAKEELEEEVEEEEVMEDE